MENTIINPKDGKGLVLIPAGEFVMGDGASYTPLQIVAPVHTVNLDAFYISRYPVTNAEYKKFEYFPLGVGQGLTKCKYQHHQSSLRNHAARKSLHFPHSVGIQRRRPHVLTFVAR